MDGFQDATALVTGASGGIGAELARQLAPDVRRLLLVARSEDRLAEVADGLPCDTRVLPCDLADAKARSELLASLAEESIDILVNNAGVGLYGELQEASEDRLRDMIELNVTAPVELVRHLLPGMLERGCGRILNVGSVAGYQGVPCMSVYGATKAFLNNFSEGLAWELRGTGVHATLLAPGSTQTDFFRAGGVPAESMVKLMQTPTEVARVGLAAMRRGRVSRVSGVANWCLVQAQRFVPRWVVGGAVRRLFQPASS